eukprot:CAMPEP_0180285414 /NCGR_PEP_ID=MMETSP0988-20121125/11900_1 /TAXON_ID=697907 /ORGANISM="non described non described, Strain CCMP2293" /LENGTH=99 /DNA_ID=CAMNT_0022258819 /DNA_START=108 /DNA_END=403 /DNA_ORIENTATION=+
MTLKSSDEWSKGLRGLRRARLGTLPRPLEDGVLGRTRLGHGDGSSRIPLSGQRVKIDPQEVLGRALGPYGRAYQPTGHLRDIRGRSITGGRFATKGNPP